jgi:preprotein translocase subunit SecF
MKKNLGLIFFILLTLSNNIQAQSDKKPLDLTQGTVQEKFNTLYQKSGSYQNYKVIKKSQYRILQKQVLDSLNHQKKLNKEANLKIGTAKKQITDLQTQLQQSQDNIAKLQTEKDEIRFLGIPFSKSDYQMIVWSLISILILALIYFVYMFRASYRLTKEAKEQLQKIEEEYNTFRSNALEREQLLKRQLLDEQKKHQA